MDIIPHLSSLLNWVVDFQICTEMTEAGLLAYEDKLHLCLIILIEMALVDSSSASLPSYPILKSSLTTLKVLVPSSCSLFLTVSPNCLLSLYPGSGRRWIASAAGFSCAPQILVSLSSLHHAAPLHHLPQRPPLNLLHSRQHWGPQPRA